MYKKQLVQCSVFCSGAVTVVAYKSDRKNTDNLQTSQSYSFQLFLTISVLFMNPAAVKFKQDKFYYGVASSRIKHCNPQRQSPVQNLLLYVWSTIFLPNVEVYTGFVQLILFKKYHNRSVIDQNFWTHI
jgi:hypothetical protein